MTILYVTGPVADDLGAVRSWDSPYSLRPQLRSCSSDDGFLATQPDHVPIQLSHAGPEIGEVLHLEHQYRQLFAVGRIDVDRIDLDNLPVDATNCWWYWSANMRFPAGTDPRHLVDGRIVELSVTTTPAMVGLGPLQFTEAPPSSRSIDRRMRRAHATMQSRRRDPRTPLHIERLDDRGHVDSESGGRPTVHRQPGGPQYTAGTGRILNVR